MKNSRKLAEGLKNSNEASVAELAKAYLALDDDYNRLYNEAMMSLDEHWDTVILEHEELLKRLED